MMQPLIDWDQAELAIGIDEIDNQHRELVDILNRLNEAVTLRQGATVANAALDQLHDYTRIHFAVEESIMRLLGYPDYAEHKLKHERLVNELHSLSTRFHDEGRAINHELMFFLKTWLTTHIQESDREYADHFLAAGVQTGGGAVAKAGWMANLVGRIRSLG